MQQKKFLIYILFWILFITPHTIIPGELKIYYEVTNHIPFTKSTIQLLIPSTQKNNKTQSVTTDRWVCGNNGQQDIIQSINRGNLKSFDRCIRRKDDFLSTNSTNYSPYGYLIAYLEKSYNPHRAAHKQMFKIATIEKIKSEYGV